MASANMPSANEPAKGLILVQTVKLKPMIKAQILGKMLSSGKSEFLSSFCFSILREKMSKEVDDDYYE